ncbi:MAG: DEAD/DEAH box helicase family protein [Oscillospiraceae bacterium]|nr:DEAD/DEAH box helicase family protein [Oscillospiraceae bacterium]
MTNFDFLKKDKEFESFAEVAITAEKLFNIDISSCVFNIRRAAEFAVKWMYSVDKELKKPYQDNFVSLINTPLFKEIVGKDILQRIDFIRILGNNSAHTSKKIKPEQAELALENLFYFLDFVAYCYGNPDTYVEADFNRELLKQKEPAPKQTEFELDMEKLIAENKALKEELTKKRQEQVQTYVPKPLDLSEKSTRKIYIDTMLEDAGWVENKNWYNEYELEGMPNKSGVGYADYVLFGDDGKPLAVVEAKKTCKDVAEGRQQAKLYADLLEKKFGRRPVIFLTNGFDTRIWNDKYYPERKVSGVYSKRDLEKEFNKLTMRTSLANISINDEISGRYYQKEAIKSVCNAFDSENRRKALLVMATGSGKTRTVISLVDVLIRHGWVKNVLFLADRNSLVTQAKRAFVNLLPNLSVVNLCEDKENFNARGVFSTYQTMMNCIDSTRDENDGRLYTVGHFDLIICDEAHRSIYNKYRDIFNYFDAHLVGLTATPRDEIDKNTYGIFELENGVPTYGYELAQAVQDGYLVDFVTIETELKLMEQGIVYDDLSDEDKEQYEELFASEDGEIPEFIDSAALNEKIFNKDTIRHVLAILMEHGIKIDYGNKIGKTIIFAKNHKHAEEIYNVFNEEYPNLAKQSFCRVVDNYTSYAQSLIDEFSDPMKLPQIVVSVDMMDTGIDVPEVLNLVFFKKVMSRAKFWQMIGRGTRLCPKLLDGKDKDKFYIFDFCSNFDFFRMNKKGNEVPTASSVQERIFNLKVQIIYKLQDVSCCTDELTKFRNSLIDDVTGQISQLNKDNFSVQLHLRYVEQYSDKKSFETLNATDLYHLSEEVAPLILPIEDEINAVRFDALMYGIELGCAAGTKYTIGIRDLKRKARAVSKVGTIPAVMEQADFLRELLNTDYIENAGINEFEIIREKLRDLMKYIPHDEDPVYYSDIDDDILSLEWNESDLSSDELQNYKLKVNHYIRQHADNAVIEKLHTNQPLTDADITELEKILWSEVGTKEDYQNEYQDKPLGELVREIIGLDMNSAKEAFSKYLNDVNLDERQIYFVNQIINYIVQNGMMKDFSVLQDSPFTDKGDVADIFADTVVWVDIMKIIKSINANAILKA